MTPAPFLALLSLAAFAAELDPFAGVVESTAAPVRDGRSWPLFQENFGFRKELMSEFATSEHARASSRQSAGFEVLKKFSSETATKASVNFQGRLVRRDRFVPVQNDMEGMHREGWYFEYHNAYADLYDVFGDVGRWNARIGRFYLPFGLNLQTDTHGTILQLSNERNFGFERDWYAGLWGSANEHVNYDAYYLAGSGYYPKWEGQKGLGALRLSLGNRYGSDYGLEGGVSGIAGERLAGREVLPTSRGGVDARWRRSVPTGLFTGTAELSGGRDEAEVLAQLYQADYLRASRRWGLSAQYRRFWKRDSGTDSSIIAEASWYFRNDVAASNLHWIKLNVERKLGPRDVLVALQYYRYW